MIAVSLSGISPFLSMAPFNCFKFLAVAICDPNLIPIFLIRQQCEGVWDHPDRCAYVDEFCGDHQAGLINYIHLYFCNLNHMHALALVIMVRLLATGRREAFAFFALSFQNA